MEVVCKQCGEKFNVWPSQVRQGKGKFCSKICATESRIGKPPWNKGLTGKQVAWNKEKKLNYPVWNKGKKGCGAGEKNGMWKGDGVGYFAKHAWIRRKKGKASKYKCELCDKNARDWANIDHKYKRKLEDYIPLCVKCHRQYDKEYNNWGNK